MSDFLANAYDVLGRISPAGYICLVIALSVVCQWVAWRLRFPSILLLLTVGFGLGQVVSAEHVLGQDVVLDCVTLTVGIILFEGSLSLRLEHVRGLGSPVRRLCSLTVALAWVMITVAAWLLGFNLKIALLIGAILVVTGPTVINPILRALRPTRRVSSLLRWEGIVVDPIGAVLALLVFQGILAGEAEAAFSTVLLVLGKTVLIGFGIGLALGVLLEVLMRRQAIPDFLHGVVFLAAAVSALVVSNVLQEESGLLTVTVLGVYLGNRPGLHLEHVAEFKEHLQILFVGALFVVLAGRVSPAQIVDVAPQALIFLAALVLIVRPVSVWLGLLGTNVTRQEKTLLSCMAPRGIVAAAVASIFALGFANAAQGLLADAQVATGSDKTALLAQAAELDKLAGQASSMVPLVFIVIVCTVAIYGFGIGRVGERLSLATAKPQGIMFAGVNRWVIDAAALLEEHGVSTLVVARNYADLANARMAGLQTETANIISEYAVKDMDLAGIGSFLACTPEDEINATAAREFVHVFGRANTFQLHRDSKTTGTGNARRDTAGHLSAHFAFVPSFSRAELDERMLSGMRLKYTRLSKEFTYDDFTDYYGDDTVVMFVQRNGATEVAHADMKLPYDDGALISMVREEDVT
ncbi:sodium/proton antiporter (CPA1 family) [Antricoccus suffuscus]|uniref:Sodium/proton antiporter (CPA1 family) n=1 Tax=Antricoccus suffuscus TaxID=1629062 RepID=A0A2T1A2L7_9ACTN|nr:sodium:proton antiporter [Antricoccus suffuscus]PRZ42849.1 sodium/proton antiporter (CPA1 family) [Antricoccus suffuscus]